MAVPCRTADSINSSVKSRCILNNGLDGVAECKLLIVVGVTLDTMKQMEAQLTMRRYEGFIK